MAKGFGYTKIVLGGQEQPVTIKVGGRLLEDILEEIMEKKSDAAVVDAPVSEDAVKVQEGLDDGSI